MRNIIEISETKFQKLDKKNIYDCIVIQSKFNLRDLSDDNFLDSTDDYLIKTNKLIEDSLQYLKTGGLIFIYGAPKFLPFFSENLFYSKFEDYKMIFKYWIGIEYKSKNVSKPLPTSHIGMLMFLKSENKKTPTPFHLNTKEIRVPYQTCPSCGKITKDWGGKKHLMNPLGSSISDVWSHLTKDDNIQTDIPDKILNTIYDLINKNNSSLLFIKQKSGYSRKKRVNKIQSYQTSNKYIEKYIDTVVHEDCNIFMNKIHEEYPDGVFDLCFSDPPYNLSKNYSKYDDTQSSSDYINWCNEWLSGMSNILKPGGSLFVLNIPKWSIHHYTHLSKSMNFQNWIIWDSLSTPMGKILPSHYSLLHFTKPNGEITSHYNEMKYIDNRKYCLNQTCVKNRKLVKDDDKELITDIWKDIHRIKHRKDRDSHPCQLPSRLLDRIIKLYSNENDIIFDPFGGTGTTSITSKINNRHSVITELDEYYVEVSNNNLSKIKTDLTGKYYYERETVQRKKKVKFSNRDIESSYLQLCMLYNKPLEKDEVKIKNEEVYHLLNNYSKEFRKLKNIAKRQLETLPFIT